MSEQMLKIVNHPMLWAITVLMISILFLFAAYYIKISVKAAKKLSVTDAQIKAAVKASVTTSIGPSIAIMFGMIALLILVGAPTALMRLSVVGAVSYETMSGAIAAETFNTTFSVENITPQIFQATLFVMAVGCIAYMIIISVFCKSFGTLQEKMARSAGVENAKKVSAAAILGCYAYLVSSYAVALNKNTVAMVVGCAVMYILQRYNRTAQKKWIREWSVLIAMITGMLTAVFA